MKKRIQSVCLLAALCLALGACSQPTAQNNATTSAPPAQTSSAPAEATDAGDAATPEPAAVDTSTVTTFSFLMDWNGGASSLPVGFNDGPVAKEIIAKTGARIEAETITMSETEKLAMVFASGDVPDITNGPFWNTNPGGEGELIKKAAMEGMLLPLNQYMEQFPNVKKAMTNNISEAFLTGHLENKDFNGERYIIPNKPMTDEDNTNWAYGVFARKDILESLNVDPKSIDTAEKLRDLLEKIKAGGFTDINGKPVIPAGNWHNGWSYDQYLLTFQPGNYTDWGLDENGEVQAREMLQNEIDRTLYMRNLVADGLYDAEALMQSDTMGREKMATGRVATFGCHWPHMNGFFESSLYLTNPEMEFIPLGPFKMANGETPKTVYRKGAYGFGCLFLSAKVKDPIKALNLIDYLTSDEGMTLCKFGIEGVHYDMVDGVPTRNEKYKKMLAEDAQQYYLEGFAYQNLSVDDRLKSYGWDPDYNKPGWVYAREVRPLQFFEGYTADDIAQQWEKRAAYDEKMATENYNDVTKKMAIAAASDEEAIKLIEDHRKLMRDAGYDEMMQWVHERMKADPSIVY